MFVKLWILCQVFMEDCKMVTCNTQNLINKLVKGVDQFLWRQLNVVKLKWGKGKTQRNKMREILIRKSGKQLSVKKIYCLRFWALYLKWPFCRLPYYYIFVYFLIQSWICVFRFCFLKTIIFLSLFGYIPEFIGLFRLVYPSIYNHDESCSFPS